MGYKNGRDILPQYLLDEIQNYIQGEIIYIPKMENTRIGWGENNGTRSALYKRNTEIYTLHKNGASIQELVDIYLLSEDSIRKIITKFNKKGVKNKKYESLSIAK